MRNTFSFLRRTRRTVEPPVTGTASAHEAVKLPGWWDAAAYERVLAVVTAAGPKGRTAQEVSDDLALGGRISTERIRGYLLHASGPDLDQLHADGPAGAHSDRYWAAEQLALRPEIVERVAAYITSRTRYQRERSEGRAYPEGVGPTWIAESVKPTLALPVVEQAVRLLLRDRRIYQAFGPDGSRRAGFLASMEELRAARELATGQNATSTRPYQENAAGGDDRG